MKKYIVYILFLSMSLASCNGFFETVVDLDVPPHESKLAVTAELENTDKGRQIIVSYSVGGLEEPDDGQLIDDAQVSINGTDMEYSGTPGIYFLPSDFNFEAGSEYQLNVSAPGYDSVSAEQVMPDAVPINNFEMTDTGMTFYFDDPEGEDYYIVAVYVEDEDYWMSLPLHMENSQVDDVGNGIMFKDIMMDSGHHSLHVLYDNPFGGETEPVERTYVAVLKHITEDAYRYKHSLLLNNDAMNNPFAEPVIVHSNIANGYGVFSLSNVSDYTIDQ